MNLPAPGTRVITLLGGAAILSDGVPVGGRAAHRHAIALLALLVANGGKPISRDKLVALLWPERDADAARNLLKVNAYELRKELGDGAIRSSGDLLSADAAALHCDVLDFLGAVERGDDRAAAERYAGPFLDGLFLKDAVEFERWVDAERTRLGDLYSAAVERLAEAAERAGDHASAVRWRRAHATHEPYRPDVARRLIHALAAAGNAEGAIQFATSFGERRAADLGIEDDGQLVAEARGLASLPMAPAMRPIASVDNHDNHIVVAARQLAARAPGSPWLTIGIAAGVIALVAALSVGAMRTGRPGPRSADNAEIERMARAAGLPDERIAALTRRPLAAARDYIAGERAYRAARYAAAESLYARALSADTTFGVAGLGLALANSWTGINEHYGMGRNAAMKYQAAMSPRDRAFALAFFGPDPALGAPRPAPVYLTAWEDVVEKWPDWTEAWYQLGDRFYHFGGLSGLADAPDRARTAFRRALSQDTTFAAPLHHLIELYAASRETGPLRDAGARYFAANPNVDRDRSAIGWEMAMALGDTAWLARVRANMDAMPREDLVRVGWVTDANGWPRDDARRAAAIAERKSTVTSDREKAIISSFTLSANGGDVAEARRAAQRLGGIFPDAPVGALWDLYLALFGDGDSALAADAASRLSAFAGATTGDDHVRRDQHHQAACLVGYWSALRGNVAAARASAARVQAELKAEDNEFARRNANVCLAMVSATIAERTHAPDAASLVAKLDTILLRERVPPHVILAAGTIAAARLHAALGDTAAALVASRRREHLTGDPLFLSTQLREEATYARATGDTAGAARALAHLAALRGGSRIALDTLRNTAGPRWRSTGTRHFVLYREEPVDARSLKSTADSLERAWSTAVTLIGQAVNDTPRAAVFVTRSRTRFGALVSPEAKGLTTHLPDGNDVIVLVQNDSVRAYFRHEVMHLVSFRAWGAPGESRAWLAEGLATFADGKCLSSTVLAESRELLAARRALGIHDIAQNFLALWRAERAVAYVLAGSLVDYLWSSRGREGVRALWTGRDSVVDVGILPGAAGEQTARWREYVARASGGMAAPPAQAFRRAGCG